jgi:hypothetical protein
MIYYIGGITTILAWLLNVAGVFPRFLPTVVVGEYDVGFYAVHLGIFVIVAVIVLILSQVLGSTVGWRVAVTNVRSRHGTTIYLDWLLLLVPLVLLVFAIGAQTSSAYLISLLGLCVVGSLQSLVGERERRFTMVPARGVGSADALALPVDEAPAAVDEPPNL